MGELFNDRRKYDPKMEAIEKLLQEMTAKYEEDKVLLRELHQRQTEITVPCLKELIVTVNGNGKPGLKERMGRMETESRVMKWVLTGVALPVVSIVFSWIMGKR